MPISYLKTWYQYFLVKLACDFGGAILIIIVISLNYAGFSETNTKKNATLDYILAL